MNFDGGVEARVPAWKIPFGCAALTPSSLTDAVGITSSLLPRQVKTSILLPQRIGSTAPPLARTETFSPFPWRIGSTAPPFARTEASSPFPWRIGSTASPLPGGQTAFPFGGRIHHNNGLTICKYMGKERESIFMKIRDQSNKIELLPPAIPPPHFAYHLGFPPCCISEFSCFRCAPGNIRAPAYMGESLDSRSNRSLSLQSIP